MKSTAIAASIAFASALASTPTFAESGPFATFGALIANTSYDNSPGITLGGGYRFSENFDIEVGYSNFGELGFGADYSSLYYGISVGGYVTDRVRLALIGGGERLEAEFSRFGQSYKANSHEGYYGLGAELKSDAGFTTRLRVLGHSSGDIRSLELGMAFHF